MANEEHLAILRQGVVAWNKWREENPEIRPDFQNANLFGVNLEGANLNNADFFAAILWHAKLYQANLHGAHLFGTELYDTDLQGATVTFANLREADLRESNLKSVNFSNSVLRGASLEEANLTNANFREADLSWANFKKTSLIRTELYEANCSHASFQNAKFDLAGFGMTILGDVDLKGANGLETCFHNNRSILDYQTLLRSGTLPLKFLRGCGLPENLINYLPSLFNEAIQFYSCFISYSSKNHPFAERLYADLQSKEVRCWFAPEDLKIGEKIRVGIDESIRKYDKLLLVLSKHSIESEWVEKEVETAMEQERKQKRTVLFPVMLDNSVLEIESGWPADIRRSRNIGDFRKWKDHDSYQKAFDRLLRDLKAEA